MPGCGFTKLYTGNSLLLLGNRIVNNKLWPQNASVVMETSTAEVMVADRM